MSWPLRVGSLDWVACGISEALMSYVGRGRVVGDPERAFFVTNTQWSGQRGSHWISVALSMHYDSFIAECIKNVADAKTAVSDALRSVYTRRVSQGSRIP